QEKEAASLDLSDDEDLAQAFDMHSLIVSSLHPEEEDKVLTADEVISEIDDMMKVGVAIHVVVKYVILLITMMDLAFFIYPILRWFHQVSFSSVAELKAMNHAQLNELIAEYDSTTKLLSEMLVTELALRDELEFDKELKNQFISLLLTIQKKRRDSQSERKNKK
ncbi:hypothetical protein EGW08_007175, partial [Elysia chlorotica]